MNFIKKHKTVLIITLIVLILLFLFSFAVYRMIHPTGNIYGERLENAPSIDSAVMEKIKEEISANKVVESVEYKTNVKIIKFFIHIQNDSKKDDVLKVVDSITNHLSSTITDAYDIEVYFMNDTMEEYPMIGYLAKGTKEFIYTVNKVGEANES